MCSRFTVCASYCPNILGGFWSYSMQIKLNRSGVICVSPSETSVPIRARRCEPRAASMRALSRMSPTATCVPRPWRLVARHMGNTDATRHFITVAAASNAAAPALNNASRTMRLVARRRRRAAPVSVMTACTCRAPSASTMQVITTPLEAVDVNRTVHTEPRCSTSDATVGPASASTRLACTSHWLVSQMLAAGTRSV